MFIEDYGVYTRWQQATSGIFYLAPGHLELDEIVALDMGEPCFAEHLVNGVATRGIGSRIHVVQATIQLATPITFIACEFSLFDTDNAEV